jgi:hypothetical protein
MKSPSFQPHSPNTSNDTEMPNTSNDTQEIPKNYNEHFKLISTLKRDSKRQEELRRARRNFSEAYPLTVDLWKEWLSDEERMVSEDSERRAIVELYRRAVGDYYCTFFLARN